MYDLATYQVIAEIPYDPEIEFMEGDEIEVPTFGGYKIVQRRWSIARENIVLVLQMEPLA